MAATLYSLSSLKITSTPSLWINKWSLCKSKQLARDHTTYTWQCEVVSPVLSVPRPWCSFPHYRICVGFVIFFKTFLRIITASRRTFSLFLKTNIVMQCLNVHLLKSLCDVTKSAVMCACICARVYFCKDVSPALLEIPTKSQLAPPLRVSQIQFPSVTDICCSLAPCFCWSDRDPSTPCWSSIGLRKLPVMSAEKEWMVRSWPFPSSWKQKWFLPDAQLCHGSNCRVLTCFSVMIR